MYIIQRAQIDNMHGKHTRTPLYLQTFVCIDRPIDQSIDRLRDKSRYGCSYIVLMVMPRSRSLIGNYMFLDPATVCDKFR